MADYGTRMTDEAVKRTEKRLRGVYLKAKGDIDDKLKDWQERHRKRDARYRQMVAAGKLSKKDYQAWVRGQVFQEKQWQARRDEIDNILLNADRAAQNIVNEGKLGVFAANANYMGYALEHDSNIDTGFVLYSESTVARLIEDDPQILPKPAPGVKKELAFPYYNKLMSSAITQGIVQGETISEIAGRVARTTGESSYKSAMRNARTAYTGAQNAGRIEGLHQAQRLGIKVKKKWLAILDSRTRDTHRDLDGQIQEVDDPFKSDLGGIMFPGDPTAKPALVYNCRCTLTYEYPDYPSTMPRRDAENGQIVGDMTYREWERLKQRETTKKKVDTFTVAEGRDISDTWQRRPDRFGFEIEDVINAQGFDGKPRIVSAEEFDAAVKQSNFIAQRTYSAPDQETLDAYSEQLYSGKWYVDCSVGNSSFGQGMYCTPGTGAEMDKRAIDEQKNYGRITRDRIETDYVDTKLFEEYYRTLESVIQAEGITDPNAIDIIKAYNPRTGKFQTEDWHATKNVKWVKEYAGNNQEQYREVKGIINRIESQYHLDVAYRDAERYARGITPPRAVSKTETLTLPPSAKIAKYSELVQEMKNTEYTDVGVYGAAKGYDAVDIDILDGKIEAKQMLILNRTKVIFRGSD